MKMMMKVKGEKNKNVKCVFFIVTFHFFEYFTNLLLLRFYYHIAIGWFVLFLLLLSFSETGTKMSGKPSILSSIFSMCIFMVKIMWL